MQVNIETNRTKKRQAYMATSKGKYQNSTRWRMGCRLSKKRRVCKITRLLGYDYEIGPNYSHYWLKGRYQDQMIYQTTQQMKWKMQEIDYKVWKLTGKYNKIHKITNKDKWKIKEELGINFKKNPIYRLGKIQNIMVKSRIYDAFNKIKDAFDVSGRQQKENKNGCGRHLSKI